MVTVAIELATLKLIDMYVNGFFYEVEKPTEEISYG